MTRWQAFRCSHRATKRPNPERGRRARMRWIAVLALLPAAATAASWSIREAPDAASPLPQARVIADGGDEVIVFRTNDSVHLQLTIGGAFTTLSPQSCPSFQIDQRRPVHHYAVGPACQINGTTALIDLGEVQNRTFESSAIDQMMNGVRLAIRYLSADGAYHEADFPLSRSASAIKRALGTSVRVRAPQ